MTRENVYEAIDSERDYQELTWGGRIHSPEEWFYYIEDYLNEARRLLSRNSDADSCPEAMAIMRKVASMAVCAGEQHGFEGRELINAPINVLLKKLETREDAKRPQEEKYPSGEVIAEGLLLSSIKVGSSVRIGMFHTSTIREILKIEQGKITLKTTNSVYELTFNKK